MIKVNNKKTISRIARTTYQANRKRNLLTILAIILTSFLLITVIGIGIQYTQALSRRNLMMSGRDYDIALTEPRPDQIEKVKQLDYIRASGLEVKCAMITQGNGQYSSMVKLFYSDKEGWKKQLLPAFESVKGCFPKNKDEIMLSLDALKELGIQNPTLGIKIPVTYYNITEEEPKTAQEADQSIFTKTFTLSGYFKDYTGQSKGFVSKAFYETTGADQTSYGQGYLFLSLKHSLYTQKNISALEKQLNLSDRQILESDPDLIFYYLKTAAGIIFLLFMIFSAGYLFIYNTLYISIAKDIRYFGQLRTLGMTTPQLRHLVYLQAFWNAAGGIPLGLLLGLIMLNQILPQAIRLLDPGDGIKAVHTPLLYGIICLCAGIFSAFTVFISARKPAKIVGECAPMEAVRYTEADLKFQSKRTKAKGSNSIRAMAWRNMFRRKKQTFAILTSFFLVLSLFLIVSILLMEYDSKRVLNTISDSDIALENNTMLREDETQLFTSEKLQKLKSVPGVKNIRTVKTTDICIPYQKEALGGYLKRLFESRMTPGGNYNETMDAYKKDTETMNNMFGSRLVGISETEFDVLNEELGNTLDKTLFLEGKIALLEKNYWVSPKEAVGKNLTFYFPGKSQQMYSVKIAALSNSPASFSGGYNPQIIVSEKFAEKLAGEFPIEVVYADYEKPFSKETEAQIKQIFAGEKRVGFQSKLESYKNMSKTETQIKVFGNGLGLILALLTLMNYFNMMTASVQERSREFAVLESLGMTQKQIRRVLMTEGLGYGVISVLLSLLAGVPLGYVIFHFMNIYGMTFCVPVLKNLLLFMIAFGICALIPPLLYKRMQTGSLVDRIRTSE